MKWIELEHGGYVNLSNITHIQIDFFKITAFPSTGEPIRILHYIEHDAERQEKEKHRKHLEEVNNLNMDIVERVDGGISNFLKNSAKSYLSIRELVGLIKEKIKSENLN